MVFRYVDTNSYEHNIWHNRLNKKSYIYARHYKRIFLPSIVIENLKHKIYIDSRVIVHSFNSAHGYKVDYAFFYLYQTHNPFTTLLNYNHVSNYFGTAGIGLKRETSLYQDDQICCDDWHDQHGPYSRPDRRAWLKRAAYEPAFDAVYNYGQIVDIVPNYFHTGILSHESFLKPLSSYKLFLSNRTIYRSFRNQK